MSYVRYRDLLIIFRNILKLDLIFDIQNQLAATIYADEKFISVLFFSLFLLLLLFLLFVSKLTKPPSLAIEKAKNRLVSNNKQRSVKLDRFKRESHC